MDLLSAISISQPVGFWQSIIFGLENALTSYAWALILITVIIKFVLVPFDFVNRYTSKKSSRKQAEMKPELDKVNQKYGNNKDLLNQKTMEVYKAHNFNVMGTCLGMVIYLSFTMIVFWTLFGALNGISAYKISDQFLQVRQEYYAVYEIDVNEVPEGTTAIKMLEEKLAGLDETTKANLKAEADSKAKEKYDEVKTGFLWIENIWLADTTTSPVMDYKAFIEKSSLTEEDLTDVEYDMIISPVKDVARKNNGYFILAVLAAGTNFLSMSITNWISKARAKKKGIDTSLVTNKSNKVMSIVMPVIMGVFTLFYNAAFGLYIVAGALITLITSPLVNLFVDMLEFEAIKKEKNRMVAIYDRKRK